MQDYFISYFWTLEQIKIYPTKFISKLSDFKSNLYKILNLLQFEFIHKKINKLKRHWAESLGGPAAQSRCGPLHQTV
jgi:hypothetical protein